MINFEIGDSIKFGENYCNEFGCEELKNKIIMMTPQYFEEDNGLYVYTSVCAGIYDEYDEEAESIYHLFGNIFEYFMDCELIKGSENDKKEYNNLLNLNKKLLNG